MLEKYGTMKVSYACNASEASGRGSYRMTTTLWAMPISWEGVCRRASGRRAYNRLRQDKATIRRIEIIEYLTERRLPIGHGLQRHLAVAFGVSRSTICRDMKWILNQMQPCPTCGHLRDELDDDVGSEEPGQRRLDPDVEQALATIRAA